MAQQAQNRHEVRGGTPNLPGVPLPEEIKVVEPRPTRGEEPAVTLPRVDRPIDALAPAILSAVLEKGAFEESMATLSKLGHKLLSDSDRSDPDNRALAPSVRTALNILRDLTVMTEPAFLFEILPTERGRERLIAALAGTFEEYNRLGAQYTAARRGVEVKGALAQEFFSELDQLTEVFRLRFAGRGPVPLVEVPDTVVSRLFRDLDREIQSAPMPEKEFAQAMEAMLAHGSEDRAQIFREFHSAGRALRQVVLRELCENSPLKEGLHRIPSYETSLATMVKARDSVRDLAQRNEGNESLYEPVWDLYEALHERVVKVVKRHENDIRRARGESVADATPRGAILQRAVPALESLIEFPSDLKAKHFTTARLDRFLADGSGAMVRLPSGESAFLPRGASCELGLGLKRPLKATVSGKRASPPASNEEIVCACVRDERGWRVVAWSSAREARSLAALLGHQVK